MIVSDWNMMQRKLYNEAKKFLMESYGIELRVPVKINGRIKSKHGLFRYMIKYKRSLSIEIGRVYIENNSWETIYSTLKHECIHYALYELDKPFKDGHPYFESELVRHGSHSTGTVPYKGKVVVYACSGCGKEIRRKKRYPRNGLGYTATCCNSQIKFIGEKIV